MTVRNTILIVDEEKILSDLLADVFPPDSFDVFNATSSDEALRLANLHLPHLAIVDPAIPLGFQLIAFLRSRGATKVFALSSNYEALELARERGIEQIIDKNDGLTKLVYAIHSAGFNVVLPGRELIRILVVDDEPDIRNMLSGFLSQCGYAATAAGGGKEALEVLEHDPSIRLVLLDIMMPEIGGVEVLQELMQRHPRPTVVMISALHDREIAHRSIELGAFDYILKAVNFKALETTIIAALGDAEYRRQPWWKRIGA
jgi:DNA-binding response OmpR family regulator